MAVICVDDKTRTGTIKDVYSRDRGPHEEVEHRKWYVLGVVTIENPDLSVCGWLGDPMTVVVQEYSILCRASAQDSDSSLDFRYRRVEQWLIYGSRLPSLELALEGLPNRPSCVLKWLDR
eukprot:1373535-Amorphochlora_amoeboformis.AAC.1